MKPALLILYIHIIIVFTAGANNPLQFSHYSTHNGLPNDFVLSIVQDNDDFLWFGTHLGIVRFDGYRFNLYQPNPEKDNSLSYKHIHKLYADLHGNLWIQFSEHALDRMQINTGTFYNYKSDTCKSGNISSLEINSFFEDQDSTLYLATNTGINIYNSNNDTFQFILPNSLAGHNKLSNRVAAITDDSLGNIWFHSIKAIGCLRKNDGKIQSLGEFMNDSIVDNLNVESMTSDRNTKLWFTTWNKGVFCYDISTGELHNYLKGAEGLTTIYVDNSGSVYCFSELNNSLYYLNTKNIATSKFSKHNLFNTTEKVRFLKMAEDKTGNLWISSSHGVDMFNPKDGISHYKNNIFDDQSLSSNTINYIFIDHTNNLWVSNYRKGLDKADLNQKPFHKRYTNPVQNNHIFSGTNITATMVDHNNNLWVGETGKSIICVNEKSNTVIPVKVKQNEETSFSALMEDSRGDIWVGNYGLGIERINGKTLQVDFSTNISEWGEYRAYFWSVRKFTEDQQGNIWFVSARGVYKWDRETEKVIPYSHLYDPYENEQGFYRTVFIDGDGTLWSGSYNGGLARYNLQDNTVKRFVNNPDDKTSISGNGVYVIFEETDSTLLIGTTFGLNRFHKKSETFRLVNTVPSLHNFGIYSIIPDSQSNYWMATDNGLICLNKKTLECVFYDEGDGLPANEFNTTASCLGKDGNIYMGSPKGLLSFNPDAFSNNPYSAKPTITNMELNNAKVAPGDTVNGRILLSNQIWNTKSIVLNHDENDFTFQFSAMHYAVPESNIFWYMLEGYKNEWFTCDISDHTRVSFVGLPPGNYTFRLKASNNDGVINIPEDEVHLKIIILPPFYRTNWFKGLVTFLIAFLTIMVFRIRIRKIRASNILLENIVSDRTKELQGTNDLLNEHKEELIAQKESLIEVNNNLRASQEKILSQNIELDLHRNNLETLVEERTSELIHALDKAKESDRLKSAFLANMSHEIRTPMNAIIGFSTLLKDVDIDEKTRNYYLKTIITNTNSLMVLINDILDISYIQSGQIKFCIRNYSLKTILNDCFEVFKLNHSAKNVDLVLNTHKIDNDLEILTDEVRFKQVLSNIISNALKFTSKGSVEFGVIEVSDEITLYVKDTGIGMPDDIGDEIFERFSKLEYNTNQLFGGAGLGLAISKSLVHLWGGRLWYESEENKGTTFYFTHPLQLQKLKVSPLIPQKKISSVKMTGIHVLIAEEDASDYQLLKAYLSSLGANVIWAKNGQEAFEVVNSSTVDIVIMDMKLPVLSGMDIAKQIKFQHPEMPIIAQMAFNYINHTDILQHGIFDRIISKPIKRNELFSVIESIL